MYSKIIKSLWELQPAQKSGQSFQDIFNFFSFISAAKRFSVEPNPCPLPGSRALPVIALEGMSGLSFLGRTASPDPAATRDLPRERKGYSFRVGNDCAPKYSEPFGREKDSERKNADVQEAHKDALADFKAVS